MIAYFLVYQHTRIVNIHMQGKLNLNGVANVPSTVQIIPISRLNCLIVVGRQEGCRTLYEGSDISTYRNLFVYCRCYGFTIFTEHHTEFCTRSRIAVSVWFNGSWKPDSNLHAGWPIYRYPFITHSTILIYS